MSQSQDKVSITKTFVDDHWVVRAEITATEPTLLPRCVFIYENTGGTTLGDYWGVCSLEELQRLKEWVGTQTARFGNRFVRHHMAEVHLTQGTQPEATMSHIVSSLKTLKDAILASKEVTYVYDV